MRAMDGMRTIIYRKLEKQTSFLSRGDQKNSMNETTFVFSIERKIMIIMGGFGDRIALLCLGRVREAV